MKTRSYNVIILFLVKTRACHHTMSYCFIQKLGHFVSSENQIIQCRHIDVMLFHAQHICSRFRENKIRDQFWEQIFLANSLSVLDIFCFIVLRNVYFNFLFKNTLVQQTCQLKGRVLSLHLEWCCSTCDDGCVLRRQRELHQWQLAFYRWLIFHLIFC